MTHGPPSATKAHVDNGTKHGGISDATTTGGLDGGSVSRARLAGCSASPCMQNAGAASHPALKQ